LSSLVTANTATHEVHYLIGVSKVILKVLHIGLHCKPVATFESSRVFVCVLFAVCKKWICNVLCSQHDISSLHYVKGQRSNVKALCVHTSELRDVTCYTCHTDTLTPARKVGTD